jgi:hypothetical protein
VVDVDHVERDIDAMRLEAWGRVIASPGVVPWIWLTSRTDVGAPASGLDRCCPDD